MSVGLDSMGDSPYPRVTRYGENFLRNIERSPLRKKEVVAHTTGRRAAGGGMNSSTSTSLPGLSRGHALQVNQRHDATSTRKQLLIHSTLLVRASATQIQLRYFSLMLHKKSESTAMCLRA